MTGRIPTGRPDVRGLLRRLWWCLILTGCTGNPAHAEVGVAEIERSGDVLQFVLPLTAMGFAWLTGGDDGPAHWREEIAASGPWPDPDPFALNPIPSAWTATPRTELLTAVATSYGVTYGLKFSINAERPNGGPHSFPSGHTALSFTGATYIYKHHGPWLGIPALAAASYVGWSRVESRNHSWTDVIAGATIGISSNYLHETMAFGPGQLSVTPKLFTNDHQMTPGLALSFRW